MDYFILRNEETGELEKLGRFQNGIGEQFCDDHWESDASLYSLQFDGLLEKISEAEAEEIIAEQFSSEKIAA
ncbi:MAG TPA: hypothetical protein VK892_02590 [Pyrinomonadaceae bacterium]|nr:hypothetical protein [Pyrinomonadaceae bacterium]